MDKYCLYIVLTRTNTVISKLIQLVKSDQYTHAAISLDLKLDNMYSFGRKHVHNPFMGVFKQEEINTGLYKYQKCVPCLIMEITVSRRQYLKARKIIEHFVLNEKSYKYNYMGLIHSLLNKSVSYNDRFLCSEFVYYILNECGIADLKMPRNLVRPQNLLDLQSSIVFTGDLKKLGLDENNPVLNNLHAANLTPIY